ncbi:MAG: autotransporter-associated beta strand repeat-containing protein, partial [Patescibacteria group bacterium]|nr:autotransporter-associated beta strand repeat-containing protein [Patescibacteria group bacterium]
NYTLEGEAITLSQKDGTDSRLDIHGETTFNCPMIVTGNAWNKAGSGTLILNAASPDNTKYVNHNAGIIRLRDNQAAGSEYLHVSSEACVEVENNITVTNSLYFGNTTTGSTAVNLRSNSGNNTWAGTVFIHNTHEYAIIDVNSGSTLTISGRVRPRVVGTITAVGSVTKVGAGTLVLSGNNDYLGPTYLNAGITTIRHSNALGTVDAGTTVAAGATLQLENSIAVGAETLALSGTGIGGTGALRSISGTNSWAGTVALSGTVAVGVDAGTLTLGGIVSGGALTKVGAGTLVLSAANTYTGTTTIEGGTVRLAGGDNRINPTGRLYIENGGALDLNGQNQTFQLWSRLRGGGAIYLGNGTLTLRDADLYNTATISGTGQLVIEGAGLVTFATAATYTGGTIINNGRIAMYGDSNRLPVTGHVEVNGLGILDLSYYAYTGRTQTIGTLTGDGTVRISGTTFVLGNGGGSSDFSGSIVDGLAKDPSPGQVTFPLGQMRKTGTGAITLSGQS